MRIKYIGILILPLIWACQSPKKAQELPNTKLLSVISWSDTARIQTADLFDNGYADSLKCQGELEIWRNDSSSFSFTGGNSPYAVLRAFQNGSFVDVLARNIKKGTYYSKSTLRFEEKGIGLISSFPNTRVWVFQDNALLLDTQLSATNMDLSAFLNPKKGRSHLRVFGAHDSGLCQDLLMPLQDGRPINDAKQLTRDDLHGNVMYFAFIDRFFDGNPANNKKVEHPLVTEKTNFWGGDIKGIETVIQKGYLNNLGINSLWISPITRNPDGAWGNFKNPHVMFSGYHGYWPVYNTVVDPRFGTDAELRAALKAAHDSGINVLLDYVAHHVHREHPIYKKHPDWVTPLYLPDGSLNTERWDDHRLTTWFDTFMPTLDLGRPEVAAYMVDSALFWLRNFEFDGFRHDATKHIPENFTRLLTQKIRSEISTKRGKNTYQIGETYGDPALIGSYVGSGLLDAQFDFNLYDRMVDVFAFGDPMDKLIQEQKRSLDFYGSHHLMGNITGNQDRTRFMSFADGTIDRSTDWMELKRLGHVSNIQTKGTQGYESFALFYAYQLTAPGIPVIYYGDEFGMPGANDPGNRNPMKFDGLSKEELALKTWVQSCIQLRRNSMAMIYGDFEVLYSDSNHVVIKRSYRGETVFTLINRSKEPFYWEPKEGFNTYGKLKKRITNGNIAYKGLWKMAPKAAMIVQFEK